MQIVLCLPDAIGIDCKFLRVPSGIVANGITPVRCCEEHAVGCRTVVRELRCDGEHLLRASDKQSIMKKELQSLQQAQDKMGENIAVTREA